MAINPTTGTTQNQTHKDTQYTRKRKHISMHEGIGTWCDSCDNEAESSWANVAEQMGINMSDYEDDYR